MPRIPKLPKIVDVSPVKKAVPAARKAAPKAPRAKSLSKDVTQFSSEYTPLERKLINDCNKDGKLRKTETCRIIDKNGQEISDINKIETPTVVSIIPKKGWSAVTKRLFGRELISDKPITEGGLFNTIGYLAESLLKFRGATYIHNHLVKVPLSISDVKVMAIIGGKRIIAVSPDGSTSCFENSSFGKKLFSFRKIYSQFKKATASESAKARELGYRTSHALLHASPEELEKMSKNQESELRKLAEFIGGRYHSEGF